MRWRCRDLDFDLSERVLVMGVVNVTPDSFSDGGLFLDPSEALAHGRRLLAEGADILDLGAESTRPGSAAVPAAEQRRRLEPVLAPLAAEACVSVDTSSAEVARWALGVGARIVNDVSALDDPGMAGAVAEAGSGLVLMHMRGSPATMQDAPVYDDVASDVREVLRNRLDAAVRAGIARDRVALDPGIGFGKTIRHNLELLSRLDELAALGRPVLVGVSRKSFLGRLTDRAVEERLEAGLAAAVIAAFQGARIIRTHDVAAAVPALRVAEALRAAKRTPSLPSAR